MNKTKLVLIGGGGHCKSCIDVIEQEGKYDILGVLDKPDSIGKKVLKYEVIGSDDDYGYYVRQGCEFLITVGQIKSASIRKRIFETLQSIGAKIATVISPISYVSGYAKIEAGTIVMHHACVNAAAKVGMNCILNTGCCIEHDAVIGNHTHISTGAFVNGECQIGHEVFIGSNAVVANNIAISDAVIVSAGVQVMKNLMLPGIYLGYPLRRVK